MKNVLLALAVVLAPAAALADGPLVKGCCQRPQENPPRAPQKRALCSGNMWSLASHGRCLAAAGGDEEPGVCREGVFSTLVMVKEYTLTWDERLKECVLVTTGRSWPTVVAACDGNSC